MVVKKTTESSQTTGEHEKNRKKALIVAQEISFAKVLAGNDKKLRDRGVKRLRKWLSARSRSDCDLKDDDYSRLWKGLFYCMWMADKPLFQEELAETISSLVHCFQLPDPSIKFMEGFFRTMAVEWKGIDQHRLDKFLMFVRRFLRQCLVLVEHNDWNIEVASKLSDVFQATLLPISESQIKVQPPIGLVMHFTEIFLEELAKVSKGELAEDLLLCFLRPFTHHLASSRDGRIRSHIRQHIFIRLLEQSPVGLEFQDKFAAWRKLGFPGGSIDVMERTEEEEEEQEQEEREEDDEVLDNALNGQSALDPRAGSVDVELPLIQFDPYNIVKFLEEYRCKKFTNAKTRKGLSALISKFAKLAAGEYPLGMKEVPEMPDVNIHEMTEEAAEDLLDYKSRLLQNGEDEEEADDAKENDVDLPRKVGKSVKRKRVESEKSEGKKACLNTKHATSEGTTVDLKLGKMSKVKGLKVKRKSEHSVLPEPIGSSKTKKVPDVSGTLKGRKLVAELTSESADSSQSIVKSGTDALLQHLAPHLVGPKKLKRRASCDAQIERVPVKSENADNGTVKSSIEKKSKKRKSLGWEKPLQEGEYEIFIPKSKILAQKKRLSDANDTLTLQATPNPKVQNPFASPITGAKPVTPSSSTKKVNFVLQRNTAQATSDYFRTLRENPAIPFDAKREPTRSVLKPSPYSSPVNPFYKRKRNLLT